jgi:hypothetical protein
MSLEDQDAYELTRRRLEDDVKKKVEGDLFRYYRNLGSIVVTVLGAVGIGLGWPALLERIDTQIAKQVEKPVKEATTAANEAGAIAHGILERLAEKQEAINQSIGRLGVKFDEVHVRYGEASAQVDKVEEHVVELRQLSEFFKEKVQSDPVTRDDLLQLEGRLAEIVSQTRVLAAAVDTLGRAASQKLDLGEAEQKLTTLYRQQTEAVKIAEAAAANPRTRATAYVQFTGGNRADIQAVSAKLRASGWTVPGEERLGAAAGKHEVRYFRDSDRSAAELLATDVAAALADVGLPRVQITPKKVSVGKLPPEGILELWIEIPLR